MNARILCSMVLALIAVEAAIGQDSLVPFSSSRASLIQLEDFYVPFSLSYPESWKLDTEPLRSGAFFKAVRTRIHLGQIGFITDSWTIGPMRTGPQADPAATLAQVKEEAEQFERQAFAQFASYQRTFSGETVVNRMKAYEFRQTVYDVPNDVRMYGRFIYILPTPEHDGIVIGMTSSSLSVGVSSADDVGVAGDLGRILPTFKLGEEHGDSAPSKTYVNRKEKTHPRLQSLYVDFTFDYPRSWTLTPSMLAPSAFATVRRAVVRNGVPSFSTDLFSVGAFSYPAENDSVRRAKLAELAAYVAQEMAKGAAKFELVSQRPVVISGVEGLEFRFIERSTSANASGVDYYGRVILLPPTNERSGILINMKATSLSPGVKGAEDVGERGELAGVLRSFRL